MTISSVITRNFFSVYQAEDKDRSKKACYNPRQSHPAMPQGCHFQIPAVKNVAFGDKNCEASPA